MDDFDLSSAVFGVARQRSRVRPVVFGQIARGEFARARNEIADLAAYADYDDWLDVREGRRMGLSMAGVETRTARVGLSAFLEWRALTGRRPDLEAFDAFAASAARLREGGSMRVLAVVDPFDFAIRLCPKDEFARFGGYRRWLCDRRTSRAKAVASGLRVEELTVRCDRFLDWCACLGEPVCTAALDRYAELLLEHLTGEFAN